MENFDNVLSRVPDVWFDIYARIFPGLYFVFGYYFITGHSLNKLTWDISLVFILLAYVSGHAVQPLNSFLGRWIQKKVGFFELQAEVDKRFSSTGREVLVLSKQHAECVSMVAFAMFSILIIPLCFVEIDFGVPLHLREENQMLILESGIFFTFAMMFTTFAWNRAYSMKRRCERYLKKRPNEPKRESGEN